MTTRHVYLARHGEADAFGQLTQRGLRQADLLGERLADMPIDAIWHSPLERAADSAHEIVGHLGDVLVAEAPELVDHVPYVPDAAETPASWRGFFDGYDDGDATAGQRLADALTARFARPPDTSSDSHEVLITHAFQIAWLVRDALGAPPSRWLGLNSANSALTVIEYRDSLPPTLIMYNDMSHLPGDLRWSGFPIGLWP